MIGFMFRGTRPVLTIYPRPLRLFLSSFIKLTPIQNQNASAIIRITPLSDYDCLFVFIHIHCVLKQTPLTPFQTERQHVTSDGPGQDAGDRVHHLHPDLITHRCPEHHNIHRVRFLHQPPLHQHFFGMPHHLHGTGYDQQRWGQLLHIRPEVVTVSPGTGKICVLPVFEAR